ncbi:hypothetical protein [Wolbachia endosymbiont (group A) of Volucella bombylans]|uniref:hypothetical protein n=1 Tax=Wolbachia endosymbiont (group A) of Volucella bombylans TaxID=3066158 RepID=UPI003132F9C1
MPNTKTVRALVSAFNVHNYARNTVKTNFTLQSRYGKDCIVVSFDKGMEDYQCSEYLYNIKRKIVGEFYGIEEGDTDEVVLNTAKLIFDVKSFPFNDYKGDWSVGKQGRIEFVAPIDQGVIFNLKSHLASSLVKDVLEDMPTCSIVTNSFNKEKYLCHSKFPNKKLRKEFEREFLSRMRERYENAPKNPLGGGDNSVYIRDVFDDARFIDSVTRRAAWLIGRDLQADSKSRSDVRAFKDLIIEVLDPSTRVVTSAFLCASPLNREETSILIPVILSNRGTRFLTKEEARDINHKFNNPVLDDMSDKTQATFKVNGSSGVYGIDFSNKEISHCMITKIIESSVINAKHELSIDHELPRTLLAEASPTREFPKRSRGEGLEKHPRRRSKKEEETEPFRGVLGEIDPSQSTCDQSQLSLGAYESMLIEIRGQQVRYRPSSIPSPRAWDNSIFLNPGVSNEEPEKQQVTDKSDRKSSDECSEAKSQESESPEKKHGGGPLCSNSFIGSVWSKLKGNVLPSLERNNRERSSVCSISSSVSAPVTPVTEKPPVSKSSSSFPGRIRAESNPPSEVTSPTHEGGSEWQQRLNPDQREELHPFLSPEEQKKLDSNSFSPGKEQHLYLTRTPEGKRELSRSLCESEESQLRRLAEAQLSSPDNSSSKKVDRDSGFCSMGSPAAQHKGSVPSKESVPSEVKECEVEPVSEALRK